MDVQHVMNTLQKTHTHDYDFKINCDFNHIYHRKYIIKQLNKYQQLSNEKLNQWRYTYNENHHTQLSMMTAMKRLHNTIYKLNHSSNQWWQFDQSQFKLKHLNPDTVYRLIDELVITKNEQKYEKVTEFDLDWIF